MFPEKSAYTNPLSSTTAVVSLCLGLEKLQPVIKSPLLLQFAGLDKRVNAGWEDYEKVLKANNVEHTAHFYPDVNHGFHNNTTPRYDEAAATLAWTRTIDFFKEKLK